MTHPSHAALVEEVAKAIYYDNPITDQDTDEDGRICGPAFTIPWESLRSCDEQIATLCVKTATSVLSLIAARLSDVTPEIVEAVAEAMGDAEFGYDLSLIRLVEGESTYRLTYSDGTPPIEFGDMDEAYAHIAAKKRSAQARAAISAFLAASTLTPGEKGEGR